jgi:hypothetical protein
MQDYSWLKVDAESRLSEMGCKMQNANCKMPAATLALL